MKKLFGNITFRYITLQSSFFLGRSCIIAFLSTYLLSIGFTNGIIGTTLACASIMGVILAPFTATIADKYKKFSLKTIVSFLFTISCGLTALIWAVPYVLPNFAVLPTAVLFVLLISVSNTEMTLMTSLAMEHNYVGKSVNFSLARGFGSFAYAVASLAFGFVVDGFGPGFLVPAHLCLLVLTFLLVRCFPRPEGTAVKKAEAKPEEAASSLPVFIKENARFLLVVLSLVLIYAGHVVINNFPIQLITNVGGKDSDLGVATFIAAFLELPAMALFPFILKRVGSVTKIMKFAAVMMVLKSFTMAFAPNITWVYIAQSLQFFSFAMLIPCGVYFVSRFVPAKDKVKGQSFVDLAMTICGVVCSLVGGHVIDSLGMDALIRTTAFISAAGALLMILAAPKDSTPGIRKEREKK